MQEARATCSVLCGFTQDGARQIRPPGSPSSLSTLQLEPGGVEALAVCIQDILTTKAIGRGEKGARECLHRGPLYQVKARNLREILEKFSGHSSKSKEKQRLSHFLCFKAKVFTPPSFIDMAVG